MGISYSSPSKVKTKWFQDFEPTLPKIDGKTIAVTGCTTGLGLIIVKTSVRKNAQHVLLLNRPSPRAEQAEKQITELIKSEGSSTKVETIPCDLQDMESVRKASVLIKSKYEAIDVLCNNAGVMAVDDVATVDGYDIQMQTNHLSHFLLTKELFPLLKRAVELRGEARVVNHSSEARRKPATPLKAEYYEKKGGELGGNKSGFFFQGARWERYHQSKLANAVFTLALKDRFGESGLKAVCAAPGLSSTNLQVTAHEGGGMGWKEILLSNTLYQSDEDGAMPILTACFGADTANGDLFEPKNFSALQGPAVRVEYDLLCTDPVSRQLLWQKSEEACGKFEI